MQSSIAVGQTDQEFVCLQRSFGLVDQNFAAECIVGGHDVISDIGDHFAQIGIPIEELQSYVVGQVIFKTGTN